MLDKKTYNRQWRAEHPKYHKQYYQEHKEELLEYQKQYRQRLKREVLDHYSALRGQKDWDGSSIKTPCCGCCQETSLENLCIDHKAGGGDKHRESLKRGGVNFYLWLKQQGYPEGYQTLCSDCNGKKQRWDGER